LQKESVSSSLLLSPFPFSFLETAAALRNTHGKKRRGATEEEEQAKEQNKNLSLLLLKGKGMAVGEGRANRGRQNGGARISLFPI